jgi:hypothetical protein
LNSLWVFTRGALRRLNTADMGNFVDALARKGESRRGGRSALVALGIADYGLARAAQILSRLRDMPVRIRAFRHVQGVMDWLGEPDEG